MKKILALIGGIGCLILALFTKLEDDAMKKRQILSNPQRKKLMVIFFLLWKSAVCISQIYLPVNPTDYGTNYNRLKTFQVLHIPSFGDSLLRTTDTSAQLRVINGQLFYHSGYWRPAGGGGAAPNLQAVTVAGNTTTLKINALNYDATSAILMTHNGVNFLYHDSTKGNIIMGYRAFFGSTGSHVIAIGDNVLHSNTTGSFSVGIGDSALYNTTTGVGTAIGFGAMKGNVVGQFNTAMGYHALYTSDANSNTAFGNNVLAGNTTGINNTSIGSVSMFTNTTGTDNAVLGYNALVLNTTGSFNTALGDRALATNSTGSYNIGLGYNSGNGGLTGNYNIYAGRSSGRVNTGNNNVFLGDSTGYSLTSGDLNVFIGAAANWGANGNYGSSYYNTIVGAGAGVRNRGNYNTLLGFQSGVANAGGQFWGVNHAIIIGDQVDYITTKDYQINIGNRIYSDTLARIGILQKSPQYTFDVLGTGRFTDTAFGKTMGNGDSSLALATTAFVKNQKFGTGSVSGYVPYTGATQGLDLGSQILKAGTTTTKGEQKAVRVISASGVTLSSNDQVILINGASGSFVINLPSAAGIIGQQYSFKRIDASANLVTVSSQAGQNIDGASNLGVNGFNTYMTIVSDGVSTWKIIGNTTTAAGTVTSFGRTDNWGIISSVTNSTTTPNHAVGVDSATLSGYYYRRADPITVTITANRRVSSITTATTLTPDANSFDGYIISALATGITFNNPTGTPTPLQELILLMKDAGTIQTIAWGTSFRASADMPLPLQTFAGRTMYTKFYWNPISSTWDMVSYINNF